MKLILLWSLLLLVFLKIALGSVKEINDAATEAEEEEDEETNDDEYEEITEAELLRIAAEDNIHDPLNSFYDPFEPYRILTYAYWNPITNPELHKNPPLPPDFFPPNAPPKSLPTDFFFGDSAARQIVLEEHAAAFCPFIRQWRESNPLKPYPIGPEFSVTHPRIKFSPGIGYEIDTEIDLLNVLSRQATNEFAMNFTLTPAAKKLAAAAANSDTEVAAGAADTDTAAATATATATGATATATGAGAGADQPQSPESPPVADPPFILKPTKRMSELDILLSKIEEVKKNRSDCRKYEDFVSIPRPQQMGINTPSNCLQEAIFLLEEHEDRNNPVGREAKKPEIVDKVDHFRNILLGLETNTIAKKRLQASGKCPFGFKSTAKKPEPKPKPKFTHSSTTKFFKGTVPKFAELKEGEEVFSSQSDSEFEDVTKYVFPYKLVPFPSIQNTLKKYVGI